MDDKGASDPAGRGQLEELSAQVAANRSDIDDLQAGADRANHRAAAIDDRAASDRDRIDVVEARLDVDQALIAELQADGMLDKQHVTQLELALRSSREIGAAMGIVMADRRVSQEAAFELLSRASQNSNRKLRVLAHEIVQTGDLSAAPEL